MHDKSTEVAEVTEATVPKTTATEPDAKAIQPAAKTTAAKAKATEQVKQETTENKPTQQVAKPVHTHSWQPVYATRPVTDYKKVCITRCSACGADITGHASEHRKPWQVTIPEVTRHMKQLHVAHILSSMSQATGAAAVQRNKEVRDV